MSRPYRGVAAADRVADRRALLVETALDCLHEEGLASVSVRSVCARARLTPRYFYESFADLDALLVAAVDAVAAEVAAAALEALAVAGDGLAEQVRAAIGAGYGVVAGDARKATALLVAASGYGPLADRRRQFVEQYALLALANLPALGSLRQRREATATALFLVGGACELIGAVLSGRVRMARARLIDQLTALWVAALTPP